MKKICVLNFSTTSQHGQMVRVPDLNSGGHGFKSHSDHQLLFFLGSSEFNSSIKLVLMATGLKINFFVREPAGN